MFKYFYGNQADQYSFVRIPRTMMLNEELYALSLEAKLLYGLLLDRMGESKKNRWIDEEDRVYVIYPIGSIQEDMKRRYGRAWKRIRDKYAAEHPYCERCFARGVLVPVEEIHHKLPLAEGGTHDRSNLIALCKSCHSKIHAKRGDRWHDR